MPFEKSRKSKMASKPTSRGKIGTRTLKTCYPGAVLNKYEKWIGNDSDNEWFGEEIHVKTIGFAMKSRLFDF